ncbi:hypothetical protein GCM10023187_42800 [Nibrella viscosa]|uniref:Uncharacterized protein n=1 Tax=Nibrella viscosa TaxID=1084524 RepID=A0ABP8KS70_9BACT
MAKDARGRVVTICVMYYAQIMPQTTGMGGPSHREITYLGSEFFGFPIWQDGTIQIGSRQIRCSLAYNLMSDELLVKLQNSETIQKVTPEAFTIGSNRFVWDGTKGKGNRYYLVLNDGPTRLLKTFKCQLKAAVTNNGYTNSKEEEFDGHYEIQEQYYIKKGSAAPESVYLTRKSVLAALGDQAEKVLHELPRRKLTEEQVIQALSHYNSPAQ